MILNNSKVMTISCLYLRSTNEEKRPSLIDLYRKLAIDPIFERLPVEAFDLLAYVQIHIVSSPQTGLASMHTTLASHVTFV